MPPACPLQEAPGWRGWRQKVPESVWHGTCGAQLAAGREPASSSGLSQCVMLLLGLLLSPSLKLQQTCGGL